MKCGYGSNCKHGGEVDKEEAIKVSTKYWHKDCLHEKEVKVEIRAFYKANYPVTTDILLNKAVNDLCKKFEADYILWVLKRSKGRIKYPMGIIYCCSDNKNLDDWKKKKTIEEFNVMKNQEVKVENNAVKFEYKKSTKRITDLI